MKNTQVVRAIVVTVGVFAISASISAQRSADTAAGVAQSPVIGRALKDHVPVLKAALDRAWAVDPKKGVETRKVADGVFVVTDGVWQSAFVVTEAGVIVFDAPETYAAKIRAEITAVTRRPITTLVYTHIHKDHIGGSAAFKDIEGLEIVALTGVAEFLAEKNDPDRVKPTRTFDDQLVLTRGGTRIELRATHYHSDEGDLIV